LALTVFAAAPRGLAFEGTSLGVDKADWLAAPVSHASGRISASCAPTAPPNRGEACTWATRYGAISLPQSIALPGGYLARDPTYVFEDGKLRTIRFRMSIDTFDALDAQFTHRFGPPVQTHRAILRASSGAPVYNVTRAWRAPGGTVRVVDPAPRGASSLLVVYTAAEASQG
jgi:hypothetical protein